MSSTLDAALEFFRPDGTHVSSRGVLGLYAESKVAIGLAYEASTISQAAVTLVAFGFPGNGKTAFTRFICNKLQNVGFYAGWLNCIKLTRFDRAEVERIGEQLKLLRQSAVHRPLVLVASELDAIDESMRERPELGIVADEIRALAIGLAAEGRLFVLVTMTSPAGVIDRLTPYWPSFTYFDWPSRSQALAYLQLLGIPKAERVLEALYARVEQQGTVYSSSSLITGSTYALEAYPGLGSFDAEKIAELVAAHCAPAPREDRTSYRRENRRFILEAEATQREWEEQFEDRVSQEYAALTRRNGAEGFRGLLRRFRGSAVASLP